MKNQAIIYKKIPSLDINNFIITFLAAIICNIQYIANELSYADLNTFSELRTSNYWELSLGRWMLPYLDHARWGVAGSTVTSVMAAFWLAIGAVLLIRLFQINSWLCRLLTCLLLAVAPFFYDTLGAYHCSAEYMLGFTMSILCVFCLYIFKNYYFAVLLGGLCLAGSLGIYQAYLGVSCGLCVLIPIISLLKEEQNVVDILKKLLQSIYMGITGIMLYLIALYLNLKKWNWHLEDYSGANQIGLKTILRIPEHIGEAIRSFYQYFFTDGIINNTAYNRGSWHTVLFLFLLVIVLILTFQQFRTMTSNKSRILLLVTLMICFAALLFALGIIEIIVPERDINQMMCAPYILIYLLALSLCEAAFSRKILNCLPAVSLIFIIAVTIQSYFVMGNASSMATKMTLNQTKVVATNIIHSLIENNDYYDNMPVLFVGAPSGAYFNNSSDIYKMASGVTASSG